MSRFAHAAVLSRVSAPSPILTKDEVKARLFIDHNDDDAKVEANIASATGYMDGPNGVLNRCVGEQTWDEQFERFPTGNCVLTLALSPLKSVTSIKYYDTDGVLQTVDAANYEVGSNGDRAIVRAFAGWPGVDSRRMFPVVVRYVAGYASADVPAELKDALILHIGALYETRAVTPLALKYLGYDDLIAPHRRPSL